MTTCSECLFEFPQGLAACPHCGRPSLFPNVQAASEPAERAAVQARYDEACRIAQQMNVEAASKQFERVAERAQAIIGRGATEAMRLATADDQAYASFYELLHAGIRLPGGGQWDRLRGLADLELFGSYRDKIRFAALSADESWLVHYGEVAILLSEGMIAHRTTVFVENSAVYFRNQRQLGNEPPIIEGQRALWADRGRLALVKHVGNLAASVTDEMCAQLLLRPGTTSADDIFLEAHIYGPLTRRSFAKVVVKPSRSTPRAFVAELTEKLRTTGVIVDVVP